MSLEYKVCFVTTFIGTKESIHSFNHMIKDKFENADYYLITNVDKEHIKNDFWTIINVDTNDEKYKDLCKIKTSRYFKFNIFNTLKEILNKTDSDYDFYVYCDSGYRPNINKDLNNVLNNCKSTESGLLQYTHPHTGGLSVYDEGLLTVKCTKASKESIFKTFDYLKQITNNDELYEKLMHNKQYYENSIIIYDLKNKNLPIYLEEFYKLYKNNPTYRDQQLWNYLLQLRNIKPYTITKPEMLKHFFKIPRKLFTIKHYTS